MGRAMTTKYFQEAVAQQNPMRALSDFLKAEQRKNQAGDYNNLRFVVTYLISDTM